MKVLHFASLLLLTACSQAAGECFSKDYGLGGTVCVCNAEQCDTIPRPEKVDQPNVLTYTSNKAGLRFEQKMGKFEQTNSTTNQIVIDPDQKYQTVLGWGGAMTDSTGINIDSLDEELQEKLLASYFAEDGIEYSLLRVPIGGTDFSRHGYSYDDGDVDPELTNFALAEEDYKYKIPFLKRALELTSDNVQFFASAWTAPKWMKTNGEYAGYGFIIEEMYQTWADYFVKFLDSYKDEGIEFWGITTGNEPNTILVPLNPLNDVGWNATEMGRWVANNLGPAIRNSSHAKTKIMVLDDQRIYLPTYVDTALQDESAAQYIDGIAVHWYADILSPASILTQVHEHFPTKFILSTEACNIKLLEGPVILGSWERGEYYSIDIIEDMLNWVGGWIDWNMVLDLTGGPNYINNFVDSPIIVNTTAGEFYKQPMFYHLGHFSKFVPRGSIRIDTKTDLDKSVMVVAFQTPDDGTAVVILNRGEKIVPVSLFDSTRGTTKLELSERSITTVLYW